MADGASSGAAASSVNAPQRRVRSPARSAGVRVSGTKKLHAETSTSDAVAIERMARVLPWSGGGAREAPFSEPQRDVEQEAIVGIPKVRRERARVRRRRQLTVRARD